MSSVFVQRHANKLATKRVLVNGKNMLIKHDIKGRPVKEMKLHGKLVFKGGMMPISPVHIFPDMSYKPKFPFELQGSGRRPTKRASTGKSRAQLMREVDQLFRGGSIRYLQ